MLDNYDGGYKQALLHMYDLIDNVTKKETKRADKSVWGSYIKTKKDLEMFLKSFINLLLTDREAYEQFKTTGSTVISDFVMNKQNKTVHRFEKIEGRRVFLADKTNSLQN